MKISLISRLLEKALAGLDGAMLPEQLMVAVADGLIRTIKLHAIKITLLSDGTPLIVERGEVGFKYPRPNDNCEFSLNEGAAHLKFAGGTIDCCRIDPWLREDCELVAVSGSALSILLRRAQLLVRPLSDSQRLKQLTSGADSFFIEFDSNGQIIYCNESFVELLGRERVDIVGQAITLLGLTQEECQALSCKKQFVIEVVNQKSRQPTKLLIAQSTRDSGYSYWVGVRDISDSVDALGKESYQRLVEYGNSLIIRTTPDFKITEIVGDSISMIGLTHSELIESANRRFSGMLPRSDFSRMLRKLRSMSVNPEQFSDEFKLLHSQGQTYKTFVLRMVPIRAANGRVVGWEGFALDHTALRQSEATVDVQAKRIAALYDVAKAITGDLDTTKMAARALAALASATKSDCGLFVLNLGGERGFDIVAHQGVSDPYITSLKERLKGHSLVQSTLQKRTLEIIPDMTTDSRVDQQSIKLEGIVSCVITPIITDDKARAAVVLFSKAKGHFSAEDGELCSAASSQIAAALREADLYDAVRKQAASLAALYRLSHELSQYLTAHEVCEHAFSILYEELACKRLWIGMINDQRTHLVGQAGFGPAVRRPVVDLSIELDQGNEYLDKVIKQRAPTVVPSGKDGVCPGLERIIDRLAIGPFVLVPLVALGDVIGVIAVEPSIGAGFFNESRLSLLSSMANEIAAVLLVRRFEKQMAEAEKMRMAGLFAGGIAHNFNNLLQAVMGQASLVQLQAANPDAVKRSADMIIQAANKGAALVSQMLSLTNQGSVPIKIDGHSIFAESIELYRTLLGSKIQFDVNLGPELPEIEVDKQKFHQVLSNLLVNAREAIEAADVKGEIALNVDSMYVASGEISPELVAGNYLRVVVKDNGTGMAPDARARCFEPFFTTKDRDAGSGLGITGAGLGLYAAYTIVRQHGGTILVDSRPKEGSTFTLFFPTIAPIQPQIATDTPVSGGVLVAGFRDAQRTLLQSVCESLDLPVVLGDNNDKEQYRYAIINGDVISKDNVIKLARRVEKRMLVVTDEVSQWHDFLRRNGERRTVVAVKPVDVWTARRFLAETALGSAALVQAAR